METGEKEQMQDFQARINLHYETPVQNLNRFSEEQNLFSLSKLIRMYHMSCCTPDCALMQLYEEGEFVIQCSRDILIGKHRKNRVPVILLHCNWGTEYRKLLDAQIGQSVQKHKICSFAHSFFHMKSGQEYLQSRKRMHEDVIRIPLSIAYFRETIAKILFHGSPAFFLKDDFFCDGIDTINIQAGAVGKTEIVGCPPRNNYKIVAMILFSNRNIVDYCTDTDSLNDTRFHDLAPIIINCHGCEWILARARVYTRMSANNSHFTICCTMSNYSVRRIIRAIRKPDMRVADNIRIIDYEDIPRRASYDPTLTNPIKNPAAENQLKEGFQELFSDRSVRNRTIHARLIKRKSIKNLFKKKLLAASARSRQVFPSRESATVTGTTFIPAGPLSVNEIYLKPRKSEQFP